eukprot:g46255.t1
MAAPGDMRWWQQGRSLGNGRPVVDECVVLPFRACCSGSEVVLQLFRAGGSSSKAPLVTGDSSTSSSRLFKMAVLARQHLEPKWD